MYLNALRAKPKKWLRANPTEMKSSQGHLCLYFQFLPEQAVVNKSTSGNSTSHTCGLYTQRESLGFLMSVQY